MKTKSLMIITLWEHILHHNFFYSSHIHPSSYNCYYVHDRHGAHNSDYCVSCTRHFYHLFQNILSFYGFYLFFHLK